MIVSKKFKQQLGRIRPRQAVSNCRPDCTKCVNADGDGNARNNTHVRVYISLQLGWPGWPNAHAISVWGIRWYYCSYRADKKEADKSPKDPRDIPQLAIRKSTFSLSFFLLILNFPRSGVYIEQVWVLGCVGKYVCVSRVLRLYHVCVCECVFFPEWTVACLVDAPI